MRALLKMSVFAPLVIFVFGVLLYGWTIDVPWYLDDIPGVVENPVAHDLTLAFKQFFSSRGPVNLSFALNFSWHGPKVAGFHLVNIGLHLLTSFLVFLLLKRFFRGKDKLALFGALLFLSHPLQTQPVNYVVQRMTLFAGFWFFASVYAFVRYREETIHPEGRGATRWLWLVGVVISGGLAILCKQNTAVLPVVLVLVNVALFEDTRQLFDRRFLVRNLVFIVGLGAVAVAVAWRDLLGPYLAGRPMTMIANAEDLTGGGPISPLNYLFTEFSVLWLYLRLLFIPYGQMLDYGYPVVDSLWTFQSIIAGLGLLALLTVAWRIRKRFRLVSFAIAWFFTTLAVESTVIPLDPVFEHRLYIPMFGFVVFCIAGIQMINSHRARWCAAGAILLVFSLLTVQRNSLWRDPVRFWNDNVQKSALSYRAIISLADAYYQRGQAREAARVYEEQLPGLLERRALLARNAKFMLNVGVAMERAGDMQLARKYLEMALNASPNYARAYFNLGVVLYRSGEKGQALTAFARAKELDRADADAVFNWASVALELGDRYPAQVALPVLQQLNAGLARQLQTELTLSR